MKLDYKNFKKLHSNEQCTTFAHRDGHQIKVAHSKLSEKMRKEIDELPKFTDGGWVEAANKALFGTHEEAMAKQKEEAKKKPIPAKMPDSSFSDSRKEVEDSFKKGGHLAHGGMVKHYNQGTEKEQDGVVPQPNNGGQMADMVLPDSMGPQISGGAQVQMPGAPAPNILGGNTSAFGSPNAPAIPMPSQQPAMPQQEQFSNQPIQQAPEQPMQQPMQVSPEVSALEKGYRELKKSYEGNTQRLLAERASVEADYKAGHLDPQRFWNSKTDLGKASTVIGLLLGGIGQGLAGGQNMAMQYLEKQIDADVEAQKAELGKKHNLLAANSEQLKNLNDSTALTKSMMYDYFAANIKDKESKLTDPAQKQRAIDNYLYLKQKADMHSDVAAQGQTARQASPAQLVPHVVPKEHQGKVFEELNKNEEMDNTLDSVEKTFDEMDKLQTVSNRVMNPIQSKSQLDALNTSLLAQLKPIFNNLSESDKEQAMSNKISLTDNDKTRQNKRQYFKDLIERSRPPSNTADAFFKPLGIETRRKRSNVRPNPNSPKR